MTLPVFPNPISLADLSTEFPPVRLQTASGGELSPQSRAQDWNFGESVSISPDGNWAAVAAPQTQTPAPSQFNMGAISVFRKTNGTWAFYERIIPGESFGLEGNLVGSTFLTSNHCLAISSNGVVVAAGAPQLDQGFTENIGAVYIWARPFGAGAFNYQQKIQFGVPENRLGGTISLSTSGKMLAFSYTQPNQYSYISLYYSSNYGYQSWGPNFGITAELTGLGTTDWVNNDYWSSVALARDGTTVLAGRSAEGIGGVRNQQGAIYLWDRIGSTWNYRGKLNSNSSTTIGRFGTSVAITEDGLTAIVGQPGADPTEAEYSTNPQQGSVHIYQRANTSVMLSRVASFSPTTVSGVAPSNGMRFGASVTITPDGSRAFATAPNQSNGMIYCYRQTSPGTWSLEYVLPTPAANVTAGKFGTDVSASPAAVIAGGGITEFGVDTTGRGRAVIYDITSNEIKLSDFYSGGTLVPGGTVGYPSGGGSVVIPSSGEISLANFFSGSNYLGTLNWDNAQTFSQTISNFDTNNPGPNTNGIGVYTFFYGSGAISKSPSLGPNVYTWTVSGPSQWGTSVSSYQHQIRISGNVGASIVGSGGIFSILNDTSTLYSISANSTSGANSAFDSGWINIPMSGYLYFKTSGSGPGPYKFSISGTVEIRLSVGSPLISRSLFHSIATVGT